MESWPNEWKLTVKCCFLLSTPWAETTCLQRWKGLTHHYYIGFHTECATNQFGRLHKSCSASCVWSTALLQRKGSPCTLQTTGASPHCHPVNNWKKEVTDECIFKRDFSLRLVRRKLLSPAAGGQALFHFFYISFHCTINRKRFQ